MPLTFCPGLPSYLLEPGSIQTVHCEPRRKDAMVSGVQWGAGSSAVSALSFVFLVNKSETWHLAPESPGRIMPPTAHRVTNFRRNSTSSFSLFVLVFPQFPTSVPWDHISKYIACFLEDTLSKTVPITYTVSFWPFSFLLYKGGLQIMICKRETCQSIRE